MVTIDCTGRDITDINAEIRRLAAVEPELEIINPDARHQLGVGLITKVRVVIRGSVGYFCAGLTDGPEFEIMNNAGWCLAENMMEGRVTLRKNASAAACSALMGATVAIHGNAHSRLGQVMKKGLVVVQGSAGHKVGFNMMGGRIVVAGDVGENLGEFMIRGEILVGGNIPSLGQDAREEEVTAEDKVRLSGLLEEHGMTPPRGWRKVVSAQKTQKYERRQG